MIKKRKININGIEYNSIKEAADTLNIKYRTLRDLFGKKSFVPNDAVLKDGKMTINYEKSVDMPSIIADGEVVNTDDEKIKKIREKFTAAQRAEFKDDINPDKKKVKKTKVFKDKVTSQETRFAIDYFKDKQELSKLDDSNYYDNL